MAKIKIRITADGVFGANGQIPIGEEFEVKEVPAGWKGRCIELGKDGNAKKAAEEEAAKKAAEEEAAKKAAASK